ncbi:MAG: hypothetical protein RBU23_07630 [Candidatus Auribacterota bacterium]|nr:hypothetical protein [Candidatus Auribacterota bacterium]
MKNLTVIMVALTFVLGFSFSTIAQTSIDDQTIGMSLDYDDGSPVMSIYNVASGGSEVTSLTLARHATAEFGDGTEYIAGKLFVEVSTGNTAWNVAVCLKGTDVASELINNSPVYNNGLPFKFRSKETAAVGADIADWTNAYSFFKSEYASSDYLLDRASDLAASAVIWHGDAWWETNDRVPVGFGVKLATTPLIAGTFEAEVNFILYYE